MGMDKEAQDIWLFGTPRPDLTPEETTAEYVRRAELVRESLDRRISPLNEVVDRMRDRLNIVIP